MEYKIAVLPGDGIGPEIIEEAKKVLCRVADLEGFSLDFREEDFGGAASLFRKRPWRAVKRVMRCLWGASGEWWEFLLGTSFPWKSGRRRDSFV